jgi:hypothetical protein
MAMCWGCERTVPECYSIAILALSCGPVGLHRSLIWTLLPVTATGLSLGDADMVTGALAIA